VMKPEQYAGLAGFALLSVVIWAYYVPASVIQSALLQPFNVFGVYIGTVSFYGLHMEHEWTGFGLLAAAVALYKYSGLPGYLAGILVAAGALLFISDYPEVLGIGAQMSAVVNPVGSAVSFLIGGLYAVSIAAIAGVDFFG
jgi:hypothetical protein